ncbi:MAG: SpaH/EbpB family LPXTG-anchored major pilin [Lachnospiraceae bacterium]|nr:SpaH/EbpB family LPXTG-anchored major pilin [Lachnospiraceae bacterium]
MTETATQYMKKFLSKMAAACLAAALAAVPVGVSASSAEITSTVDESRECSLTISKYDLTAYQEDYDIDELERASNGTEESTSVTNALNGYAMSGVGFGIVRVGEMMEYTDGGTSAMVCYCVPDTLQTVIGLGEGSYEPVYTDGDSDYFTSNQIMGALADSLADSNTVKTALETWISDQSTAAYGSTNDNGQIVFDDLEQGLYLVVETAVTANVGTTTDPFFVSLPLSVSDGSGWIYDVYVYPKNQTSEPTIDKLVRDSDNLLFGESDSYSDTESASEGDVLYYRIVIEVPEITSGTTYMETFKVTDSQSGGLYYNEDVEIWWYEDKSYAGSDTAGSKAVAQWSPSDSGYFTVSYGGISDLYVLDEQTFALSTASVKTGTMTLTLTDSGLNELNQNYSGYYMVVVYTSTLYSGSSVTLGDAGEPNIAALTWQRASSEEYTIVDAAEVYTYGISGYFTTEVDDADPFKIFTNSTGRVYDVEASDAAFVLYNATNGEDDGYYVPLTVFNRTTGNTKDGVYYVTDNSAKYCIPMVNGEDGQYEDLLDQDITEAIVIRTASSGYLRIDGLEAGTYILTEIETAEGYSLLKDSITIVISSTSVSILSDTGDWTSWVNGSNLSAAAVVSQLYENEKTPASVSVNGETSAMGAGVVDTGTYEAISDNGYVMLSIENTSTFDLPQTGGRGTLAFTLAGALVVALGAAFVLGSKEKGGA